LIFILWYVGVPSSHMSEHLYIAFVERFLMSLLLDCCLDGMLLQNINKTNKLWLLHHVRRLSVVYTVTNEIGEDCSNNDVLVKFVTLQHCKIIITSNKQINVFKFFENVKIVSICICSFSTTQNSIERIFAKR
jgi:hypothetical protein